MMIKASWMVLLPGILFANERRFGYSVQTPVLPAGQAELELWNTVKTGGGSFAWGVDQRVEVEVGLGASTQASVYLDLESESVRTSEGLSTASQLDGFSLELKHQFSDPAADAVGTALYTELGVRPDEIEWEGKLLLDKTMGPWALVANGVVEGAWKLTANPGSAAAAEFSELPWELDGGVSYQWIPALATGLEVRFHDALAKNDGAWDGKSALFAGPTLSVKGERAWASVTVLPQITSEFEEHSGVEVRFLAGLHL